MKTILSIQSAVTAGFVGNSVAGPVLTALGHHPMLVDTVQLAAHPGYGKRTGGIIQPHLIADILGNLAELVAPHRIDSVVSGYLGHADQVAHIAAFIASWRGDGNGLYVLDPVLGDGGRLYVAQDLASAIINQLLPHADVITPNQFELSLLAGHAADNQRRKQDDARQDAELLIARHDLHAVVATGVVSEAGVGDLLVTRNGLVAWQPSRADARNVAGGGDLLTSLLTGHLTAGHDIGDAFHIACPQAQAILAASPTSRDLALLENLSLIRA